MGECEFIFSYFDVDKKVVFLLLVVCRIVEFDEEDLFEFMFKFEAEGYMFLFCIFWLINNMDWRMYNIWMLLIGVNFDGLN